MHDGHGSETTAASVLEAVNERSKFTVPELPRSLSPKVEGKISMFPDVATIALGDRKRPQIVYPFKIDVKHLWVRSPPELPRAGDVTVVAGQFDVGPTAPLKRRT